MKFAKLFMAIAVVCFAVACGGDKKEDAKDANKVDIETQVEKAQKYVDKEEWVKAAEALAKIDPADMAKEVKEQSDVVKDAVNVIYGIYATTDKEANKIIDEWEEKVNDELDKLEKEEKK